MMKSGTPKRTGTRFLELRYSHTEMSMMSPHPTARRKDRQGPCASLPATTVCALSMGSPPMESTRRPIRIQPSTLNSQILARAPISVITPALPVYRRVPESTTPTSPKAKMTAPGMPPRARKPYAPRPIRRPAKRESLLSLLMVRLFNSQIYEKSSIFV